jgi:hypothetical protein
LVNKQFEPRKWVQEEDSIVIGLYFVPLTHFGLILSYPMGNCIPHQIRLDVDEDEYESVLDSVLEQIRDQIAIQRGQRLDIRVRASKRKE